MLPVFEIVDKTGRRIRLTGERWSHIQEEHPRVSNIEEIRDTLANPLKVTSSKYSPDSVCYYYRFNKDLKRYLMVAVKYLNGEGFVVTAYYSRNIQ